MHGRRWAQRLVVASTAVGLFALLPVLGVTKAEAWSGSRNSPTLPGTGDYINTNTWMGTDKGPCFPWSCIYNWQSSTNLYGTNPWNSYYISDSNKMSLNGLSGSLSNTGGGVQPSASQVIYTYARYNTWNASQVGYNEQWDTVAFVNIQSVDSSNIRPWSWSASYYNSASATKWW
jgi:hypothetical protein